MGDATNKPRLQPTGTDVEAVRRRGTIHSAIGFGLLCTAGVGLWMDVSWLAQPFYAWVWWGYILILDGYSARKRGDSLLTTRLKFFFPICLWSITFWFFFELINARIQNWYYVGVPMQGSVFTGALFAMIAFATVFMGIFQTVDMGVGASWLMGSVPPPGGAHWHGCHHITWKHDKHNHNWEARTVARRSSSQDTST